MTKAVIRQIKEKDAGLRLDRWFKAHYPDLPFGHFSKLLRTGQVRVNGKRVRGSVRLNAGDEVRVPPFKTTRRSTITPQVSGLDAKRIRAMVIYEDDELFALNKPTGLAVQGGSGMKRHLDALLPALKTKNVAETPRLVHRLDKDTSGVLVIAKSRISAARLTRAFRTRNCHKVYWALVKGVPEIAQGRVDLALIKGLAGAKEKMLVGGGKKAVTFYKVIDHAGDIASWVALVPMTGRTHQLRVHMAAIGHPILGDGKYGRSAAHLEGFSNKLHLHAAALSVSGDKEKTKRFSAPLPNHMAESFARFGFDEGKIKDPFEGLEI